MQLPAGPFPSPAPEKPVKILPVSQGRNYTERLDSPGQPPDEFSEEDPEEHWAVFFPRDSRCRQAATVCWIPGRWQR